MDCPRIKEMLSGYLDGALAPADHKAVEEHLASCSQCSAQLEDLKKTIARLGGLSDVEPPAWLTQKVMARIRAEQPRRSLFQRLFSPLYVKVPLQAAATVLIAVVAVYIFRTVQHGVAPEEALRPQSETAVAEKKETAGEPRPVPAGPAARREAVSPAHQPREAVQPSPEATVAPAPSMPYAPAQPPVSADGVSQENRPVASAAAPARRDGEAAKEQKALKSEAGGDEPARRLRQAERARSEHAPAAAAPPRKKDERVILSDETITGDDIAKVTRVVLVHENKDELVLDVSYYLSPDFDGYATVGVFPDIPDWSVAEARAMKGRHTVSVPVSRKPSAEPGESTTLRIEIAGYRDNSFMGPLYRRIVPFGKHWEGR